jgi:hypothetical protein
VQTVFFLSEKCVFIFVRTKIVNNCANSVFPVIYYQKHDKFGISVRKYYRQLNEAKHENLKGTATGADRFESDTIFNPKQLNDFFRYI